VRARGGRGDAQRVSDILEAIARIREWTRSRRPKHAMYRAAVIRELAVLAEAAAGLSEPFRTRHQTIPWRRIVALRNQIVHAYWELSWPERSGSSR